MNMIDLMKVSAGIVLVGSVCESGMCADYKGAQLVHGLYDLQLEDDLADLTVDKIKADGGDWDKCNLANGVDNVAKAIYNAGKWENVGVTFEGLTNEAKILVYGIAKTTKGHEAENDNAGWQFFVHMFKSGSLAGDAEGIASVLNAWGDIARREALDWAQYEKMEQNEKKKFDDGVLGYSLSSWACCGLNANTMAKYIKYLDSLCAGDVSQPKKDDFFNLYKDIVFNGKKFQDVVTASNVKVWDYGQEQITAAALQEWQGAQTGEARQKVIAKAFIESMGGKIIAEKPQSGLEVSACFENSAVKLVGAADAQEVTKLKQDLLNKETELKQAKDARKRLNKSINKAAAAARQLGVDVDFIGGTAERINQ